MSTRLVHEEQTIRAFIEKSRQERSLKLLTSSIDGREMDLDLAMKAIWGGNRGAILSCIPGKLAFFIGEATKTERLLER